MKIIHTKTKKENRKVLKIFRKKGLFWINGDKIIKNQDCWSTYFENTFIREGHDISFGDIRNLKTPPDEIISFEEFLRLVDQNNNNEPFEKMDLDEFHYHEALDRTVMIGNIIENYLSTHPIYFQNKERKEKIDKVTDILGELYEEIGSTSYKLFEQKK